MRRPHRYIVSTLMTAMALGIWTSAQAASSGQLCEKKVVSSLRTCNKLLAKQQTSCLKRTGAPCVAGDERIAAALDQLEHSVLAACPDGATVADAGYPAALTPAGLADRLLEACEGATESLLARSYGGPLAAARAGAEPAGRSCLDYAFGQGRKIIDYGLKLQSACVLTTHSGRICDAASTQARITARADRTADAIARRCPDLGGLVAVDAATFMDRSLDQVDCLTAASHGGTGSLALACGPRASVPVPPLATATKITLDNATWGTRCGNGSDFGFSIRLAPAGFPVGNVVVFLQGGGSCIDGPSCAAQNPLLFTSEEGLVQTGLLQNAATNPYQNWTKVFIPYCTQDAHTGNGNVTAFPEITVHRYGARNVRAAMRYLRDVLWTSMDASDPEGFRPDRLRVLFTGASAGGAGAQFNYHYLLDDLRWTHTTLVADSALGLDNGLGQRIQETAFMLALDPPGFGARTVAPPYCFTPECGVGWNTLLLAHAARLSPAVPEQQILSVTNQVDSTQRNGSGFANMGAFVNALRTNYCGQQDTPGLHSFLSATTTSEHGNINENPLYNGLTVQGMLLRDWLGGAMTSPATLVDRVDTGTIVPDISGAMPFPCTLGAP
jgi:hypothetical protein